jgi:hypothetical protein
MNALDSSRYFADQKLASFVDDVQRGNVSRVKAGLAAGIDSNGVPWGRCVVSQLSFLQK